ncbi:Uncharacterized protein APZ42_013435, partial [Daphnia magna]
LRSPVIKPIVPKTTAIPDKIQGGKASEKTIEAVKKSASPIFKPKVKQDDAQLKKLRSNVAKPRAKSVTKVTSVSQSTSLLAKFTSKLSPVNPTPKSTSKTSFLSSTILSFFKRKNTTNGKTVETESSPPIPRDHEESGEDFPDSDEQVAIPNTSHQEPEGERNGFPVKRPEDPDPTNLVAKGHPIDISLSEQPADNGVEKTNVSSEIFDGDSRGETHHTGEEDEENGTAGETHSNEKQDLLCYISECADHGKRRKTTYLPPNSGTERVFLPFGTSTTNPPTNVSGGNSQPCPIPKKPSVTYAIGTTDPGDKITSDQTGQLPSSHQTKQRAVGGEHQTNANPNQNKLETIVTIEYHKPTKPSTTAVETQTTSEDITTHRLTSHPAITQSSIVDGSGWSNEKIIQMLRAKFTDRAFSVIQAILKENPDDYASIKESLLDHFHGDENADLYLQKFNKAKRKPGEKIVDYAHRLQETFKRAYPMGYGEKSFTVILIQKFIEGLDSKLQLKVKYKEFKDFNDLVASTRVYALRLEALETDRDKNEFIRKIDGSYESKDAELKEIKQNIIDQKELVTNAVANIHLGNRQVEEPKNKSDEIKNVFHELTQAVKKLQFDAKDGVSYTTNAPFRKQISFQNPTFNREKNWNYSPSRFVSNDNTTQHFSRFPNKPRNFTSSFSRPSSDSPYRPSQPLMT